MQGIHLGRQVYLIDFIGRDGVIRTLDPLHPMQVRYQAALRPDDLRLYQFDDFD